MAGDEGKEVVVGDDAVRGNVELPGVAVPDVVEALKRDAVEAEILLKGIQNHWFFRRAIRRAQRQPE